ncbi:MAG: PhoU domain-containing protein [Lysobacterales bacterium]|jgi:phosphate transport system protein
MSHLEQRMETDLNRIREALWQIGEDVEKALRNAKKTLAVKDEELAYATVLADHPINRDVRECDRMVHRFSARYLPGAGPLREMTATLRVSIALERIGDYAVTICREALQLEEPLPERFSSRIDELADESIAILTESRVAFRDGNSEQAIALMRAARRVQNKMDGIYEDLFAADDRLDGRTMMAIFVVFNAFKRVADQSKNICDQVVYAARGIEKIPKTYRILFLDQPGSQAGQLAVAIGRKFFSESAEFASAVPTAGEPLDASLRYFLIENGLPDEDLDSESLETLHHDLADFHVIVCLSGKVSDYISKMPFHSSALNWKLTGGSSPIERYRTLREAVGELITLLAGQQPEQT